MNFNTSNPLPETGIVRLSKNATPLLPAILSVSKPIWFNGIHEGRSPKSSTYRVEDIGKLIESAGEVTP